MAAGEAAGRLGVWSEDWEQEGLKNHGTDCALDTC